MQLGRRCAGGPVGTWEGDVTGVLWGAEEGEKGGYYYIHV